MKSWLRHCSAVSLLGFLSSVAVAAEQEAEWGDHRLIPRLQGSEIVTYRYTEFDRVSLPLGPVDRDEFERVRELEGEHTRLTYRLPDPAISTLQVKRAYRQGLEQAGFEIEFAGSGRDELGRRFHAQNVFDRDRPSGVSRNTMGWPRDSSDRDKRFMAARHAEQEVYVSVLIYNNRDLEPMVRMDVVEVPAAEPELTMEAPEPAQRQPLDRDEIVAAHEREDLSREDIEAGIISEGRVAVRDILFEFDSASIIDESAEALATIAEVLESNEGLDLLIVGHTDNVGDFDYNLNLSMQRARAVSEWLQREYDIEPERLQPAGAGPMAPVASNRDEDGRQQNRRVELVER